MPMQANNSASYVPSTGSNALTTLMEQDIAIAI